MTFASDEESRAYFTEKLREKQQPVLLIIGE